MLKYLFRVGILATTSKVVPSGGHKKLVYSKVVVRLASRHSWSHAMLWEGLKYICRQLYVQENTMPNGLKNVQLLPHETQLLSVCILYSVGKYSPKVSVRSFVPYFLKVFCQSKIIYCFIFLCIVTLFTAYLAIII